MPEVTTGELITGLWPFMNKLWRKNDLSIYERAMMMNIIGRIGHNDAAFPSQQTIASDLGVGLRTVSKILAQLRERGFVSTEERTKGGVLNYRINARALLSWAKEPYAPDADDHTHQMRNPYAPDADRSRSIEVDPCEEDRPIVTPKTIVTQRWLAEIRNDWAELVEDFDEEVRFAIRADWYGKTKDQRGYVLSHLRRASKRWALRANKGLTPAASEQVMVSLDAEAERMGQIWH